VLPDGDEEDQGLPLQPGDDGGRDVPERQQLRLLRRRAPVGGGQRRHRAVRSRRGHRANQLVMARIKLLLLYLYTAGAASRP
jgi:hypothetical protein